MSAETVAPPTAVDQAPADRDPIADALEEFAAFRTDADAALEDLRTAGAELDPAPRQPKIVNLVASGKLRAPVSLHHLALVRNLENIEYEPEQFPGLVYRAESVRAVCLVFGSGAIVVTGATTIPDAETAAAEVEHAITTADAWRPAA